MRARGPRLLSPTVLLALATAALPAARGQRVSALPAMNPTQTTQTASQTMAQAPGNTAPLTAIATPGDRAGEGPHPAQVDCSGGQLAIRAENSSLNQILRAISRCTGMRISGGVSEQRVYGNYGPATPATVIATLIDGTGTNMLLKETAADQPTDLILTPRTGGPTPPSPSTYAEMQSAASEPGAAPVPADYPPAQGSYLNRSQRLQPGQRPGVAPNQTPVPQANANSPVTSPQPIPQPTNNVNGSPSNTSPTASTYPTTNSVPLDSVATPSTTPSSNGIVDAPNPPPAGSDTAATLNGAPNGTPGTTNISPDATSQTTTPGASNTTLPAGQQPPTTLTPEQIFQQLQRQQQQQQQSNPQ